MYIYKTIMQIYSKDDVVDTLWFLYISIFSACVSAKQRISIPKILNVGRDSEL